MASNDITKAQAMKLAAIMTKCSARVGVPKAVGIKK
jgi:hypothetical protein